MAKYFKKYNMYIKIYQKILLPIFQKPLLKADSKLLKNYFLIARLMLQFALLKFI